MGNRQAHVTLSGSLSLLLQSLLTHLGQQWPLLAMLASPSHELDGVTLWSVCHGLQKMQFNILQRNHYSVPNSIRVDWDFVLKFLLGG